MCCINTNFKHNIVAKHRVGPADSGRHGAHVRAESTPTISSTNTPTRKRSLSPDRLRAAVSDLLSAPPKEFVDFLGSVLTCSVTEQRVRDEIARVTSTWETPETCGARVMVSRSNDAVARALGNMIFELFDAEGVPLAKHMPQMHPFDDDASTIGSFPDRLTLDLLPFMSERSVIYESCHTILNHISKMFEEMGLNCVPEQGGLSELRVVSSFKLAHSQVPFTWDSSDKKTTFVFVMPLQATTAVTYVGQTPVDVFGYRKDLRTDIDLGDTVVSFGQALYLGREMKQTRELVTSIVVAVYTIDSSIPTAPFTRPHFQAANELAALTGVPPMQVCVGCHVEIRDRETEGLWGNKSVDVGKGFHCRHCREGLHIPAFLCGSCRTGRFADNAGSNRVRACALQIGRSNDDPLSEFVDGWLAWEVSVGNLREGKMPCLHASLIPNNLGEALMNVLSLEEIQHAAALFKQWYLSGNIVFDLAPSDLQEFFTKEDSDKSFLWPIWRELYVENSHCSRVVLCINALIGALSIGPLVRGIDPSSGKARKVTKAQPAFYGTADVTLVELRSRLWNAARISTGLITSSEMHAMALKTLRHIQKGAWSTNFKCTCNIQSLDVNMSMRRDRNQCRGPVLNLAIDQVMSTGRLSQRIRAIQTRWAEEMTREEFTRFMAPKPETDHRFW